MKRPLQTTFSLILIGALSGACQEPHPPAQRRQAPPVSQPAQPVQPLSQLPDSSPAPNPHAQTDLAAPLAPTNGAPTGGVVRETMDAASYTYIRLQPDGGAEVWVAGPQTPLRIGDRVAVSAGMSMRGFESKTLGRRFDEIWFVDHLAIADAHADHADHADHGHTPPTAHAPADLPLSAQGPSGPAQVAPLAIPPLPALDGGLTVAQVLSDPQRLEGQQVRLRAAVVRVNSGIMGRDWLHLQDGTAAPSGAFDLTATSAEGAPPIAVSAGDVVLIKGTIALNRDFGAGYRYDVLLEDAVLEVERR